MTNESSALAQTDNRLPLHARVKEDLSRRLRANEWPAGESLPAETILAEEYGIALGTLRRVLAEFAADGLVERRQGHGTFVRRASFQHSLFRFFRMGGDNGDVPASRILHRDVVEASREVADALRIGDGSPVLHLQRLRLWKEHPFLIEDIWLPLPLFQPISDIDVDELGALLYPEYENRLGVVIGSATETLGVTESGEAQAALLKCESGASLVRIERIARTHADEIVEYRKSFGLSSSFHYQVEVR